MDDIELAREVYVICRCGEKHLLKGGIDAPVYWCGNILKQLKVGDDVEYEEENSFRNNLLGG